MLGWLLCGEKSYSLGYVPPLVTTHILVLNILSCLQNKPEDIELRYDSAQLSPLQKDNGDLEDDGVCFSHTQSCDGHESEVAQIRILNSSLTQSKVEGF